MKVSVICVADRPLRLPLLVWSLTAQTHTDWELIVLDQSDGHVGQYCGGPVDLRQRWVQVDRAGDWGYRAKADAARHLASGDAVLFPQDDSYYVPIALQRMSAALDEHGADLVVCGWLYDLFDYSAMPPNPRIGHVDIGGFMVRRSTFLERGWPDGDPQTTDGRFVECLVASGARVATCQGNLFVRN